MTLAELQAIVGTARLLRDRRCPTCPLAQAIRVSDGQVTLEFPDGQRTWADPQHVERA